jgi:hypothetical protein
MTRDRLAKLIRHPSTSDQEAISALEEIVARFPYYTNGHILLTMQYRLLDHIRYDSQLRRTSVYVPDRAVLRRLVLAEEEVPFPESIQVSEEPLAKVEAIEEISAANDNKKAAATEVIDKPAETPDVQTTDTKLDPREVIEQRLKELKQQEQLVRDQLIENTNLEAPIIVPIKGESTKDADVVKLESIPSSPSEIETSQELNVQIEPKEVAPAIQPPKPDEEVSYSKETQELIDKPQEKSEPRSFSDWLRVIPSQESKTSNNDASNIAAQIETNGDYFGIDPTHAADGSSKSKQDESIIDKFIREEPRIVPSKSEFYSPGNMARKSAQEHEDLISETLARIYAQQGNIAKAISTYERLALKLPQKKAYFASLIDDLLSRS